MLRLKRNQNCNEKRLLTLKMRLLLCTMILVIKLSTAFGQKLKTKNHWWFPVDHIEVNQIPSKRRRKETTNHRVGRVFKSFPSLHYEGQWISQQSCRIPANSSNWASWKPQSNVYWETHEKQERSLLYSTITSCKRVGVFFCFHYLGTCHFLRTAFSSRISTVLWQYKHSILDLEW